MYRCNACDSPAQKPHAEGCPLLPRTVIRAAQEPSKRYEPDPWWPEGGSSRKSIGSGEDVCPS